RRALWALKALGEPPLPLFVSTEDAPTGSHEARAMARLPKMPLGEHVVEDYASLSLTLKRHPLAFLRREPPRARRGTPPRTPPPPGRSTAHDRRGCADPPAPGQRQWCGLHHRRGRDGDRQSDRLARHPRAFSPRGTRRNVAALQRQIAA